MCMGRHGIPGHGYLLWHIWHVPLLSIRSNRLSPAVAGVPPGFVRALEYGPIVAFEP